jgi:hypothetical protein
LGIQFGGEVVEIINERVEEKRPMEMVLDVPKDIPKDTT